MFSILIIWLTDVIPWSAPKKESVSTLDNGPEQSKHDDGKPFALE